MRWAVLTGCLLSNNNLPLQFQSCHSCRRQVPADSCNLGIQRMTVEQDRCRADGLALANVGCSGSGPVVLMFFEDEQPITALTKLRLCDLPSSCLKNTHHVYSVAAARGLNSSKRQTFCKFKANLPSADVLLLARACWTGAPPAGAASQRSAETFLQLNRLPGSFVDVR